MAFIYFILVGNLEKRVLKEDHTDINTYTGDRDVLSVEEMFQQYNIIPDAGAVSKSVSPTAIVGHAFIENNDNFKKFKVYKRDENKEIVKNKKGEIKYQKVDLFDKSLQKRCL